MTEDNRGPVKARPEDDDVVPGDGPERQEAAAPPETVADQEIPLEQPGAGAAEPEPEAEPDSGSDRLVAGGFAPPDGPLGEPRDTPQDMPMYDTPPRDMGPQEVPLQDVPPRDMPQPPPPVPLDKPFMDGPEGRPRPGFVPHHQDPRAQGQPPYGGWPQQSHQGPPPPGGRPPMGPGGPPPAPMGPPPMGGPRPMGAFGPPPGGPNWAPVPALPSSSGGGPGLGLLAVVALIVALVAGAVGAGIGVMATGDDDDGGAVSLGGGTSGGDPKVQNRPPDSVAGVAQRVLPSVVSIRAQSSQGEVGGTGFIVNGGYVITNNHVVAGGGGGQIQIVFNDKKTLPATVKGTDPSSDVAVLKPEGQHSLPALQVGDSAAIAVGDPVIAIGSPLGLQGSVTTGIVSSLNRAVPTQGEGGSDASYLNAIQTDAAINPGNSGGPLVDAKGRVIGINTAIATLGGQSMGGGQGGSIGLGFAIPINQGKRVAEEIIRSGAVKQAKLGVLPDPRYQQGGARIMQQPVNGQDPVTKNGPADKAGLKPGDVIITLDGKPIEDATDLIAQIRSRAPGDRIKLTYQRAGKEATVEVTLAAD
ncbi:S1C family serine protease [Actinomadura rubrisoli]|uniref:PDZ domain-containing protein n=1 Tax=Actinomadura rubrisoli TaxID=2530368 RepID=A0A4R5CEN1_9ACTN|nr:trypsin-like peptidase domain-containing protein [Actinomadura rubrisoli]TDD95662.1 PDZ domain-containing protein [Actinomadura rubrisoli]